jgi:hypothetical protein
MSSRRASAAPSASLERMENAAETTVLLGDPLNEVRCHLGVAQIGGMAGMAVAREQGSGRGKPFGAAADQGHPRSGLRQPHRRMLTDSR